MNMLKLLAIILLLALTALSGCTSKQEPLKEYYFCPDGRIVENLTECSPQEIFPDQKYCPIANVDILNVFMNNSNAAIHAFNSGKVPLTLTNSSIVINNITYYTKEIPLTLDSGQENLLHFAINASKCPDDFNSATVESLCTGVKDIYRERIKCVPLVPA